MSSAFHIAQRRDLEWQRDIVVLTLGQGVQVKVLYEDKDNEHVDMLIRFPAGYLEPRHNHARSHSVLVLQGVQIAEGEPLHPGDYLSSPTAPDPTLTRLLGLDWS